MVDLIKEAKKYIEYFIKNEIESKGFLYHNLNHTLSVYERANYLSSKEDLTSQEKFFLSLATLFHDTGLYTKVYQNHENESIKVFKDWLKNKKENFSDEEYDNLIRNVSRLILATKVDYEPKLLDEKIIKDSDLDNLGTDEFFYNTMLLHKELENILGTNIALCEMLENTYNLFKNFDFFTNTQKKERLAKWKENFNILKSLVSECKQGKKEVVYDFFRSLKS